MPAHAKHRTKLTERRVGDHIRSGVGANVILWDAACPGLGLRKTSWIVRVHPRGGRKIVRAIGAATGPGALTLAEARELATKRITEIRGGDDRKAAVMTVRMLVEHWLENHRTPIKRTRPADDCDARRRCKLLTDRWGSRRIDSITHRDVQALHDEITRRGHRYEANRVRGMVRAIWNCAAVWRFLPASCPNPVRGTTPNRERERDVQALSPEQLRAVLVAAMALPNPWHGALFCLLALTGARYSEIASLTWADIDLRRGTMRLRDRKAGDDLTLPLSKPATDVLRGVERVPGCPWIFPASNPRSKTGHVGQLHHIWTQIVKDAGLPKGTRVHDLRSALATAVTERAGLKVAQKLLGHHEARTTMRYVRPSVESERAALEVFSSLVALPGKVGT